MSHLADDYAVSHSSLVLSVDSPGQMDECTDFKDITCYDNLFLLLARCINIYLETSIYPVTSISKGQRPQKQGPNSNQNKGHLSSR